MSTSPDTSQEAVTLQMRKADLEAEPAQLTTSFISVGDVPSGSSMYDTILLPVNASDGTEAATIRAFSLADVFNATVHVLHVLEFPFEPADITPGQRDEFREFAEQRGRTATAAVTEQATDRGIETVEAIVDGEPHRSIREYAHEHDVDLITMGTHGRQGAEQVRLGSTTERVLMLSDVPVLSVRTTDVQQPPSDLRAAIKDVVVPTDGSEFADRAAEHALSIAELSGATVHAVYVVDEAIYDLQDAPRSIVGLLKQGGQQAVDAIATDARDRGLSTTSNVLQGNPEMEILEYAGGVGADLIAMGTRGQAAGTERVIGSTTARVVRRFDRPLLTVG